MMIVQDIQLRELRDRRIELSASVRSMLGTFGAFRLAYRLDRRFASAVRVHGDPFATGLLIPAMALGEELRIEGPISRSLLRELTRAGALLSSWNADSPWLHLHETAVFGDPDEPPQAAGTGLFFTGGVDSFHSIQELGERIDRLVFVHGFDIPLTNRVLRQRVSSRLARAAGELGLEIVEVATNYRVFSDPIVSWIMAHGGALAATGHVLGAELGRIVLSSSDAYITNAVYGTHPELDRRWSSASVQFTSFGTGLKRRAKLAAIQNNAVARRHLRVCWKNRGDRYNCCRCSKCLRTMLQLEALGVLGHFPTFPDPLPVEILDRMSEPAHRLFIWEDLVQDLRRQPGSRDLISRIQAMLERSRDRLAEETSRQGRPGGAPILTIPRYFRNLLLRSRWLTPARRLAWAALRAAGRTQAAVSTMLFSRTP